MSVTLPGWVLHTQYTGCSNSLSTDVSDKFDLLYDYEIDIQQLNCNYFFRQINAWIMSTSINMQTLYH